MKRKRVDCLANCDQLLREDAGLPESRREVPWGSAVASESRKPKGSGFLRQGTARLGLVGWLPMTFLVGASVGGRLSKSNGRNIKICPKELVSLSVLKHFIPPFHILTTPGSCWVYTFLNPSTPQSRAEVQDTSLAGGPSPLQESPSPLIGESHAFHSPSGKHKHQFPSRLTLQFLPSHQGPGLLLPFPFSFTNYSHFLFLSFQCLTFPPLFFSIIKQYRHKTDGAMAPSEVTLRDRKIPGKIHTTETDLRRNSKSD